jgi:hypothetical protein
MKRPPMQRVGKNVRKTFLAAAVLAVTGLLVAAGRPGVLTTKSGARYDGTIDEREQNVLVNVRGIETVVPRDDIASLVWGDFEQRWNEAYAKLDAAEEKARVEAGRKAFDERRYDLAERAMRDTLAINPANAAASDLLKLIINQRRLESIRPANPTPGTNTGITPPNTAAPGTNVPSYTTLDDEQINRIKLLELRDTDTKVRFSFTNNVRKRFWDTDPTRIDTNTTYAEFLKQTPLSQAMQIIQKAPDLMADIKVSNDPDVFVQFKRDVQPLVLQGCATSACHGGNNEASAKWALINPAADARSVYTNFFVMNATRINQNAGISENVLAGGPQWSYMLERTRPAESLLLNYGLPETQSDNKHPRVRGYNGIFRKNDPRYNKVLNFIKSLSPVISEPDYGVAFKLERKGDVTPPAPTTAPATRPATAPNAPPATSSILSPATRPG